MTVSVKSSLRWAAMAFAFALTAGFPGGVLAQTVVQGTPDSVQTYTDQAMPPDVREGEAWNRPYKAGELKLVKPTKEKKKPSAILSARPNLPVGQLQAPQMPPAASPPKIASPQTSSASVMLMQGMKNALQQSGQNPNLPKSSLTPIEPGGEMPTLKAPTLDNNTAQATRDANDKPVPLSPEAASEAAAVETPKATELEHAPVPLDQIGNNPATDAAAVVKDASPSIFGAPVDETKPPETATTTADTKPCNATVTAWIKTCGDAGYPTDFAGQITGETRTECPSGDVRDVWLTNSCAAPTTSIAPAANETTQTAEPTAAETVATSVADVPARMDASCGAANGLPSAGKPAADLCQFGTVIDVSGDGPWRWSCKGEHGGMTVSCAATAAPKTAEVKEEPKSSFAGGTLPPVSKTPLVEDAKCGSSDGAGAETAPTDNLCAKGIASRVNGGGPWTWACSGTNGGVAVACNAAKKVDGVCGSANNAGADSMPIRDLCASGFASAITGNGPWNWTCSGTYGGSAATCSAAPRVNAVCGSATLSGHRDQPKDGLCNAGQASAVTGEGPWEWSCAGSNGGAEVSCKGPTVVDGMCGVSSGASFTKAPSEELCHQGNPSRVTGTGPWNWTCSGLDDGSTASCTAVLATPEPIASNDNSSASAASGTVCGSASEMAAFTTPTQNLCNIGKPSAVVGGGPWSWTCEADGHSTTCSTLAASEGSCGTASNVTVAEQPSSNLCASGTPGMVGKDSKDHWVWDCQGSMGAATVSCSAPMGPSPAVIAAEKAAKQARCGSADGRGVTSAPASELCDNGKPSAVKGKGPWSWACATKSGSKAACEAPKIVDGACGNNNGAVLQSSPSNNLCRAGTATELTGSGPWLWSCVGTGGGSSVSCSAAAQSQAKVDGTCGVAANATMTTAPSVNLCDSGMPSNVYGEGPWNWTCSGLNGGIASTCATNKSVPKAPPPPGPMVNGNCGPSNGVAAGDQPETGLCSSGTVTSVSGNGPWNWSCLGANGGMTVSCTAPLMPPAPIEGVCGSANGITTLTTPRSGLCSAGISSAVSGKGPWTWSCSGTNGGGAVGCVAPVAGKTSIGTPSMVTPGVEEEAPVPKASPAGLVTPRLPKGPLPPLQSGSLPELRSSKPMELKPDLVPPPPPLQDNAEAPLSAPDLPQGTEPLMPPPIRDTLSPPPAIKTPSSDADSVPVANSKFDLPADVGTIIFLRDSDAITKDALPSVDKLAAALKKAPNARITLVAYADNSNITPREARRLSLARALAIRDYLTAKGVSSSRIDVRALGANVASGDPDRVDVKVN